MSHAALAPDTTIIACATVAEELRHLGVPEASMRVLEFGLHTEPEDLKKALQAAIDAVPGTGDILLGYGLCSYAVVGLRSETHRLVIPKVDDCIALFLGSRAEQLRVLAEEPGTYYLTKGWIEAQDYSFSEYGRMVERYGEERARRLLKVMLANYTRIALINTGNYGMEAYREFAKQSADFLELRFEEIPGSNRLLLMLLAGDWAEECVVTEPGTPVALDRFTG